AELLKQLGRNRRQSRRLGFRFARHKFSLGACYALNTKFLTGPKTAMNQFAILYADRFIRPSV
ncbi:hypothetical protein B7L18_019885, partial [Burkholderia cenocepacia]|uniref:hypothetical protein n=1 Tax=Burkholderia cenocepacia TaxID=95486 RepID=UPI0022370907